ncbi:restriction endonuclease subunit S [Bradyrhizobium ottawaense]|uniref:restriction endonuclease subunit S n=1 Tax=Bradyrhizobium ottawaense TaxID=931866 RepID=UPI001BA7D3F5|nr:restriction endonuclease subunit S [Bradyrhizobium ottawaense]MBR1366343.1 restriction endonuclease subunit S [Bradyrhizobium ottawaense]
MNAERLLEAFDRLGDDPETVQQFRKLVIGLAMSGKLTTPDDVVIDPASMLEQIEKKKGLLLRDDARRKQSSSTALSQADLPQGFNGPANFTRLGYIARIEKGLTGIMKAVPGPYPLVVTAENRASCDHFDFDGAAAIVPLVSSAGHGKASLQRLHYQEGKFALGSILAAIFPYVPGLISARFLFEYLTSFKDELLVSQMIGTANVTLSVGKLADVPVPLIPPSVQGKVDRLMALCDRLEGLRARREEARDRFSAASLARLNEPDPETFQTDVRFVLKSLPSLTARADQINALRQTILRLAVRGELVSQDSSDEPASKLLSRIEEKRAKLFKSGYPNPDEARTQIKKLEEQSVPDGLDVLPIGWAWATLLQCSALVIDCKNKTAPYSSSGIRLIRTTNVRDGRMNLNDQKFVDQKIYEIWSARCTPEPGDILITREAPMGEVCLIPAGEQICLGQRMMLARLVPDTIDRNFMLYSLRDPKLMDRVQDKPIGATVQHLRVGGVETLLIPVPPLAEQRRIVAKLDAMMALCDRLEASLATTAEARRRLLDALLAEAVAPWDDRELEAAE